MDHENHDDRYTSHHFGDHYHHDEKIISLKTRVDYKGIRKSYLHWACDICIWHCTMRTGLPITACQCHLKFEMLPPIHTVLYPYSLTVLSREQQPGCENPDLATASGSVIILRRQWKVLGQVASLPDVTGSSTCISLGLDYRGFNDNGATLACSGVH